MKSSKDLFDIFRDNQHKLNERPGSQTWRRLEKRLDKRRKPYAHSLIRVMAMAAAVLLLLGVFSVLPVFEDRSSADSVAFDTAPAVTEDLIITPEAKVEPFIKVVEYSRKYQDRMSQPIEEGSTDKKLIVSQHIQDHHSD